jgi:chromosome segregation ATPase
MMLPPALIKSITGGGIALLIALLLFLGGGWYLSNQAEKLANSQQKTLAAQLETKRQRVNELETSMEQAALAAAENAGQLKALQQRNSERDAALAASNALTAKLRSEVANTKKNLMELIKNDDPNSCVNQSMPEYITSMLSNARAKNGNTVHHQN